MASPLALPFPAIPPLGGVTIGTARAGYKPWARNDCTLVALATGTTVAGLTTRSLCPSPEVEAVRARLPGGFARALVVNAGNSNAFTGEAGRRAMEAQSAEVARLLGADIGAVFPASTGVIGVPLPQPQALAGVRAAHARLGQDDWRAFAEAIGTTDTFPKGAWARARVGAGEAVVAGVAKGSGMIAPDLATMLAFIFTDQAVQPSLLQAMLAEAADRSFHAITVDGDTSTSDTLIAFATGAAGGPPIEGPDDPGADALAAALDDVCHALALAVVRDGEGASRLIEIRVMGAVDDPSARRVAMSIANSPLVKTAVAGGDANWGRVVMAVGKAGEPAERDRLAIRFGGVEVAREGAVVPGYDEGPVAAHLAGREIEIGVDLGLGTGRAVVWTTDLTHGYVSINADYRS